MKLKLNSAFKYFWSYLKAKFGKKTSFDEYLNRLENCRHCSWNVSKKNRNYCKGCFCPQTVLWPDAELRTKATYYFAECPRKKWN